MFTKPDITTYTAVVLKNIFRVIWFENCIPEASTNGHLKKKMLVIVMIYVGLRSIVGVIVVAI